MNPQPLRSSPAWRGPRACTGRCSIRKTLKIGSFPDKTKTKAEPFTYPCTRLLPSMTVGFHTKGVCSIRQKGGIRCGSVLAPGVDPAGVLSSPTPPPSKSCCEGKSRCCCGASAREAAPGGGMWRRAHARHPLRAFVQMSERSGRWTCACVGAEAALVLPSTPPAPESQPSAWLGCTISGRCCVSWKETSAAAETVVWMVRACPRWCFGMFMCTSVVKNKGPADGIVGMSVTGQGKVAAEPSAGSLHLPSALSSA